MSRRYSATIQASPATWHRDSEKADLMCTHPIIATSCALRCHPNPASPLHGPADLKTSAAAAACLTCCTVIQRLLGTRPVFESVKSNPDFVRILIKVTHGAHGCDSLCNGEVDCCV